MTVLLWLLQFYGFCAVLTALGFAGVVMWHEGHLGGVWHHRLVAFDHTITSALSQRYSAATNIVKMKR
jgi:branched-subunit amino acid transport protein